jgi:hypothetical protein
MDLCWIAFEYDEADRWFMMWEWIQGAKGRTFSEFMGIGSVIPSKMGNQTHLPHSAVELLQDEQRPYSSAPADRLCESPAVMSGIK